MSSVGAQQDVQVSVGKNFVIMGSDRVEVSPESNVVVYTCGSVQAKPAAGSGEAAAKGTQVSISADFNRVVLNGATIERAVDGHLVISTPGTIITKPRPANDIAAETKGALRIGDPDAGGVYVGKSATSGIPLHAALADEPEHLNFDEAFKAAEEMRKQPGREHAHVPTPEELNVNLYQNRDEGALKGTFNTSSSIPGSLYRSDARFGSIYAQMQYFGDGLQSYYLKESRLSVRLVW